jgi:predicted homoserine dehydrogenase-like protein
MIIIDKYLQEREEAGKPIRVGLVGAGFMGRGVALQMLTCVPGMRLLAVANRHPEQARRAYVEAGIAADDLRAVETVAQLDQAVAGGKYAFTDDALLLCRSEQIDVIVEITGAVEFGAHIATTAIAHGKHYVTMNAELDGTVGGELKRLADRAGVVYTVSDGDQPGVIMNLYRFVKGIGVRPVLCGNIKGLHDPYRNPTTQEGFAKKWGQNVNMVTSFADGTKISFEQGIVANATGMSVLQRGMIGPTAPAEANNIQEAVKWYPQERLLDGSAGYVDYCVGAIPGPGVFVLGTHDNPRQQHYLNLYKLGEGPLYCFYTPYHLCHFEVHNTVARAMLFGDAALAPAGAPVVDVIAAAKVDLTAGQELDGIGGYHTYGLAESAEVAVRDRLLPMGLAEGCRLKRAVAKDRVLTYDDVVLPAGRLADRLRAEQTERFFGRAAVPVVPAEIK